MVIVVECCNCMYSVLSFSLEHQCNVSAFLESSLESDKGGIFDNIVAAAIQPTPQHRSKIIDQSDARSLTVTDCVYLQEQFRGPQPVTSVEI
jgi:hypothetical protein